MSSEAGTALILKAATSQPQSITPYEGADYGVCATASAQIAASVVLSGSR